MFPGEIKIVGEVLDKKMYKTNILIKPILFFIDLIGYLALFWLKFKELKQPKRISKKDLDLWLDQGWIKGRRIKFN